MEGITMYTSTGIEPEVNEPEQTHRPGELYKETFDQILTGLLVSLKKRDGKLDEVSLDDIVRNGNVDPKMMEMYFRRPKIIMDEVVSTMKGLIERVPYLASPTEPHSLVITLFKAMVVQPLMTEVLLAANYHFVWENNLKTIAMQVFSDQLGPDDDMWDDYYQMFCSQFTFVLRIWARERFASEKLLEMARLFNAWISADKVFLTHARA